MRFLVVALVALAMVTGYTAGAGAVGYQVVGQEECDCSPLVARGIVPDPLNKLHQAFYFPSVMTVLDQIAVDLRSLVVNASEGAPPEAAESTSAVGDSKAGKEKDASVTDEKPRKDEQAVGKEKPAKEEVKPADKKKKKTSVQSKKNDKKKINVPPRAKERVH